VVVLTLLATALTACGPDPQAYSDKLMALTNDYTSTFHTAETALTISDISQLEDPAWQEQAKADLAAWEEAGIALANIPEEEVPADFVEFNRGLDDLATATSASVEEFNAAIDAQDIDALIAAVDSLNNIVSQLDQISSTLEE
jgi:hypothetical protein